MSTALPTSSSASVAAAGPPLSDAKLETTHNLLVLRTKLLIGWNAIRHIRSHLYIHAIVGTLVVLVLIGAGAGVFGFIFSWLMAQPVFGAPLMDRLIGIVLLVFFIMLLFSNLIITLSTTYLSREVEFLMAMPISRQAIYRQKLIETILYSSWAFALLSLPLFFSLGATRGAPWYFYPLIIPLVVPFLVIPAALGSLATMLVTSVLPARKTRTLCIVLGIVSLLSGAVIARATGMHRLMATANQQDFLQIMNVLSVGSSPILPSAWLANALQAIAPADPADIDLRRFGYWFAMLLATALFLMELTRWLVPPLYYRGWCLSRDAAVQEVETNARLSPFRWVDAQLDRYFPSAVSGLLAKDLKCFWRDPSQWTQLVILFGLMIFYFLNLGNSVSYSKTIQLVVNDWRLLLCFFNLGATCFILSILTTRFVYPMLSMEGRGFWTVGLAPIPWTHVVWQKYVLCFVFCLLVSMPLILISNAVLDITGAFAVLSYGIVILMSGGLTSLSIGIGAIVPDFKEDNPARIANGIGGTLNVFLSLLYIIITVVLLALPVIYWNNATIGPIIKQWIPAYVFFFLAVQAVLIVLPMRIGLKRWAELEF
jgi:ABC-2 type transport system permease protein